MLKTYEIFTTNHSVIQQAENIIEAIEKVGNPPDIIRITIADYIPATDYELNNGNTTTVYSVPATESKSSTNSEIGSYHWFHTLVGRIRDVGKYLEIKTPSENIVREWGKALYDAGHELMKGFEGINYEKLFTDSKLFKEKNTLPAAPAEQKQITDIEILKENSSILKLAERIYPVSTGDEKTDERNYERRIGFLSGYKATIAPLPAATESKDGKNYVSEILHGMFPAHPPQKSYRDVIWALRSAMIFANNLPQGASLTGQLVDIACLIWDYERMRLELQTLPAAPAEQKPIEQRQRVWVEVPVSENRYPADGEDTICFASKKGLAGVNGYKVIAWREKDRWSTEKYHNFNDNQDMHVITHWLELQKHYLHYLCRGG